MLVSLRNKCTVFFSLPYLFYGSTTVDLSPLVISTNQNQRTRDSSALYASARGTAGERGGFGERARRLQHASTRRQRTSAHGVGGRARRLRPAHAAVRTSTVAPAGERGASGLVRASAHRASGRASRLRRASGTSGQAWASAHAAAPASERTTPAD